MRVARKVAGPLAAFLGFLLLISKLTLSLGSPQIALRAAAGLVLELSLAMPTDENGDKWACEPCIRGHRSTKCEHFDRFMLRVKKPGRPLSSCPHPRNSCSCGRERVMMARISRSNCLCAPRYVLGPDGNPLPTTASLSSTPRPPQPRPQDPPAQPSQPQRPPNTNPYRIAKKHSRSGSVADPQKLVRTLDHGKILGELSQPYSMAKNSGLRPRNFSTPLVYPPHSVEQNSNGAYRASVSGSSISSTNTILRGVQRIEGPSFIKQESDENSPIWNEGLQNSLQSPNGHNMWQPNMRQQAQGSCCSTRTNSQVSSPASGFRNSGTDSRPQSAHLPTPSDHSNGRYDWAASDNTHWFGKIPNGAVPDKPIGQHLRDVQNDPPLSQAPQIPDASNRKLCECGPNCDCLMCPEHPYNEHTMQHMRNLHNILEEDMSENQSASFSAHDSFMSPFDLDGISQNLYNAFPNGVHSPTFPTHSVTTSPVESLQMPYTNASAPMPSQHGLLATPLGTFDSSQYMTYEFPFSRLPPCSEPNGTCMCDENCTCVGCLTHKNPDRNGTPHQNPTLPPTRPPEAEVPTNGHTNGHEPAQKSCCS